MRWPSCDSNELECFAHGIFLSFLLKNAINSCPTIDPYSMPTLLFYISIKIILTAIETNRWLNIELIQSFASLYGFFDSLKSTSQSRLCPPNTARYIANLWAPLHFISFSSRFPENPFYGPFQNAAAGSIYSVDRNRNWFFLSYSSIYDEREPQCSVSGKHTWTGLKCLPERGMGLEIVVTLLLAILQRVTINWVTLWI